MMLQMRESKDRLSVDSAARYLAVFGVVLVVCAQVALAANGSDEAEIVSVRKIWDKGRHNAFTDLVRFKGKWFCTFREAENHWSPGAHGKIRVIASPDGDKWHSVGLFSKEGDLRDPKLSITPENELMLLCFRRFNPHRHPDQHEWTMVSFSPDGKDWGELIKVGYPDHWLWRVTWHEGKAYGVSRGGPEGKKPFSQPISGQVLVSDDGTSFEPLADAEYGGECTIRFADDETGYCLRRSKNNRGIIGIARPPYEEWEWKELGKAIGGPELLILPDGRFVAASRRYDGKVRTALQWLDPAKGTLHEFLTLPSGGDTSYPGLVWHNGLLWVSYYSSHEGKTSIYLAKVRIPE